jgi:hypothetical protein
MSHQVLTTLDFNNSGKIVNLPDGVNLQDPVTVSQLNSAVEGLSWKDNVVVASPGSNVSILSPGASIDGISLALNNRVLLKDQTAQAENGIYIWNGAAVPMTRAVDANSDGELSQAIVTVEQGTSAGSTFRQTAVNPVVGTTAIVWTAFGTTSPAATTTTAGISALATQPEVDAGTVSNKTVTPATLSNWSGRIKKFSQVIGDNTATSFTVTHNFGTRDVVAQVYRNSGNYDLVLVDVNLTSTNQVQVVFNTAPAASSYKVVVFA